MNYLVCVYTIYIQDAMSVLLKSLKGSCSATNWYIYRCLHSNYFVMVVLLECIDCLSGVTLMMLKFNNFIDYNWVIYKEGLDICIDCVERYTFIYQCLSLLQLKLEYMILMN